MKSLKIFYLGERLKDVYPHATKWQVFKFQIRKALKVVFRFSMAGGSLYVAFIAGAYLNPIVTYATQEKIVTVDADSPVMERIAKCESGGSHYDKNGQVVINATQDIGKYQINVPIWGKTAHTLGFNLSNERDNKAMAYYIYKNFGTGPWSASFHCWNR